MTERVEVCRLKNGNIVNTEIAIHIIWALKKARRAVTAEAKENHIVFYATVPVPKKVQAVAANAASGAA